MLVSADATQERSKAEGLAVQATPVPAPGAKGAVQDGSACSGAALVLAAPCSRAAWAIGVEGGMAAGAAAVVALWGSILTLQKGIVQLGLCIVTHLGKVIAFSQTQLLGLPAMC